MKLREQLRVFRAGGRQWVRGSFVLSSFPQNPPIMSEAEHGCVQFSKRHGLMQIFTRVILALILVMQSLPGLTVAQCAAMGGAGSDGQLSKSVHPTACPCCSGGDDSAGAACPTGDRTSVCHCGEPRQDEPKTPPTDSKGQFHQLLVILPALIGFLPPEPMPTMAMGSAADPSPHRPTNSIQSLLCVWIV